MAISPPRGRGRKGRDGRGREDPPASHPAARVAAAGSGGGQPGENGASELPFLLLVIGSWVEVGSKWF